MCACVTQWAKNHHLSDSKDSQDFLRSFALHTNCKCFTACAVVWGLRSPVARLTSSPMAPRCRFSSVLWGRPTPCAAALPQAEPAPLPLHPLARSRLPNWQCVKPPGRLLEGEMKTWSSPPSTCRIVFRYSERFTSNFDLWEGSAVLCACSRVLNGQSGVGNSKQQSSCKECVGRQNVTLLYFYCCIFTDVKIQHNVPSPSNIVDYFFFK